MIDIKCYLTDFGSPKGSALESLLKDIPEKHLCKDTSLCHTIEGIQCNQIHDFLVDGLLPVLIIQGISSYVIMYQGKVTRSYWLL